MALFKLPSGISIRTFAAPPSTFNIDQANDSDRAAYGFPRLPAADASLQVLRESKARRYRLVEATFRPRNVRRRDLPKLKLDHTAETTPNWSGGITVPPAGDHLRWIEGNWPMPSAALPPNAQENVQYCASAWVGMDGDDGSQDVLQAGCDADITLSGDATQHQYCPWWEWYPLDSQWITNMPVSPGDVLDCLINLQAGSNSAASIFLGNKTTNVGLTFAAEAPAGSTFAGNCAEWIIEAFGTLGPLANYNRVVFADCNAGSASGQTVTAGSGTTINMVDASGNVVSTGTIPNPTEVQVSYV